MKKMSSYRVLPRVIFVAVGLLFCGNVFAAGGGRGPGDYDFYITHGGAKRMYRVHVPSSYNLKNLTPLVLAFHGGGGSVDNAARFFRLNEKSDKEGFIVVYPQGIGKELGGITFGTWNAGRCCGDAKANKVDDVGFVKKMLIKIKKDFAIDEKRIYMTGFSNGGQMVFRLACEMSDVFAAAAPGGSVGTFDDCQPKKAVPIFHFDGTEDPCSPYKGGKECGGCFSKFFVSLGLLVKDKGYFSCDPVSAYIDKWIKLNGCRGEPSVSFIKGNTACMTYVGCKDGAEVTSCITRGGGHAWPGNKEYEIDACLRKPNGYLCQQWRKAMGALILDYDATDAIWDFFKKHTV